jgi:hypothetical protein
MRFLVVLDARSPIGSIYANGSNDGFINDGDLRHPVLDCTEIATDSPYYLVIKRELSSHDKTCQSAHIPHSSIVAIHHYADEGSKPYGFAPQPDGVVP